jgi:hypothetical protein
MHGWLLEQDFPTLRGCRLTLGFVFRGLGYSPDQGRFQWSIDSQPRSLFGPSGWRVGLLLDRGRHRSPRLFSLYYIDFKRIDFRASIRLPESDEGRVKRHGGCLGGDDMGGPAASRNSERS